MHERLEALWGDRLRCRWSSREGTWHIEQKLEKGARQLWPGSKMPATWAQELNDSFVRRRDGYTFVVRITRGDRFECPLCGDALPVRVGEVGIIQCDPCSKKGTTVRLTGGYWDLGGSMIIDALQKMDPAGRYQAERSIAERVDRANQSKEFWRERSVQNHGLAVLKDEFMDMFPKAGFSSLTTQEWRMN